MAQRSRLQRITDLTQPPTVGTFYLVPVVYGVWYDRKQWWPVMGPLHEDDKFFHFPWKHYHLDRRFIPEKYILLAVTAPINEHPRNNQKLSEPTWARRKCLRSGQWFPVDRQPVMAMQAALAGAQCQRDAAGWVCPHRRFSLGSVAPDHRGIIRCPLHGLQVHAETGLVVQPEAEIPMEDGHV